MAEEKWLEVKGELPLELVETMCDALMDAEIGGVQTITADCLPPGESDPPAADRARLIWYIQADRSEDPQVQLVRQAWQDCLANNEQAAQNFPLHIQPLDNQDWKTAWKAFFHPIRIGERLWISPSWEEVEAEPGAAVVRIDPGMAFGTGGHETTSLVLQRLEELARENALPQNLLDVGTGSGVLSIAAAKLGVPEIVAIDNDPECERVTVENLELNEVSRNTIQVSLTPLAQVAGPFDFVIANIISSVLLRLKEDLVRVVAPGGRLLLSGILTDDEQDVQQAFEEHGLKAELTRHKGEWSLIQFRRV